MAILRGHSLTLADAQSLGANWTSDVCDTSGFIMGSFEYHITNDTHVGTLTLLGGNQPDPTLMQPRFYVIKTGSSVTSGALSVTNGAAFDNLALLTQAGERYYCWTYAFTSGAGALTLYASFKG